MNHRERGEVKDLGQYCFPAGGLHLNIFHDCLSTFKPQEIQQVVEYSRSDFRTNPLLKFNETGCSNLNNALSTNQPSLLLLTPAIFGSAAGFILGFRFFGQNLIRGYDRYIYFLDIYSLVATLGVGYFIYESRIEKMSLYDIFLPALLLMFYFGTIFNLTYSLYPDAFSGSIDKSTPLTQFLCFLSLGVTNITVGGTLDIVPVKAGVKVLFSITGLFTLFIFSVIISLVT